MVRNSPRVFVDTSFFKALIDEKDDFYVKALSIWPNLKNEKVELVTSNFILDEAFTLIRTRCGLKKALEFREFLAEDTFNIKIIRVLVKDESKAWIWFVKNWSGLSYTDCTSFALMERLEIQRVATFDKHFSMAGFKIES